MSPDISHLIITLVVTIVGGIFSLIGVLLTAFIGAHMKDQKSAAVLTQAIHDALGAMQQSITDAAATIDTPKKVRIDGVPDHLTVGVMYVMDHAGQEMAHLRQTPEMIADRIRAQIGLRAIATHEAERAAAAFRPANVLPGSANDPLAKTPRLPF